MREFNFQNALESVQNLIDVLDMQNGISFKEFTKRIRKYCEVLHHKSLVITPGAFIPDGMSGYSTWSEQAYYIVTYDQNLENLDRALLEHVLTHEFVHILLMHVASLPSIENILTHYFNCSPREKPSELLAILQKESFLQDMPETVMACRGMILGNPEQEKSVEYIASSLRGFIMPEHELVTREEIYYW